MARDDPQMKLRLPEEMRDRLKAAADTRGRSMNAEIIHRLESYDAMERDIDTLHAALEDREQRLFDDRAKLRDLVTADPSLASVLEEQQREIDRLRLALVDSQYQLAQTREKLAYQEGMTASIRRGFNVVVRQLARSEGDKEKVLASIFAELKAGRGEDESQ